MSLPLSLPLPVTHFNYVRCILYRESDDNHNNNHNNLHPKLRATIRKQCKRFILFDRIGIMFNNNKLFVCVCARTRAWNIFNILSIGIGLFHIHSFLRVNAVVLGMG